MFVDGVCVIAKISVILGVLFDVCVCAAFLKDKEYPDWKKVAVWTFLIVSGIFLLLSIFYGLFLIIGKVF